MSGSPEPSWQDAASFALRAHAGQLRKDGKTPYAAHVVRVAMTVRDIFLCDDSVCLCAAYLHDTIEDTPADYDDILEGFGKETADIVAALTKDMRLIEPERERAYDEQLARAGWRASLVKLADVYDNLLDCRSGGKATSIENQVEKCARATEIANRIEEPPEALTRAIGAVHHLTGGARDL